MVPCKSTAEEVSFEWSHHRIWSTDSKVRTTLHGSILTLGGGGDHHCRKIGVFLPIVCRLHRINKLSSLENVHFGLNWACCAFLSELETVHPRQYCKTYPQSSGWRGQTTWNPCRLSFIHWLNNRSSGRSALCYRSWRLALLLSGDKFKRNLKTHTKRWKLYHQ